MRQLKISKQLTNRDSKAIDKYLSDVSREEMITADEEVELAKKIRRGDTIALERLVNANLRFVISVAKQYQGHGLTLEDLIAEGNLGLITAAQRFDETKGFKFISYAVWWIRQGIMQAIAEHSRVVRLPLNKVSAIQKISNAYSKLEQKYERAPSAEELSEALETNSEMIADLVTYSQKQISMDAPLTDDGENTLASIMENENSPSPAYKLIRESLCKDINRVLVSLKSRESDVLRYTFGLNGEPQMTLEEISNKMGLTRERIRQIRDKALRILRKKGNSKLLQHYL